MKKIRVGEGYITNIELSCGKIATIDVEINKQPATFKEENAELIKTTLEEYYKNKDATLIVEIVIEDF